MEIALERYDLGVDPELPVRDWPGISAELEDLPICCVRPGVLPVAVSCAIWPGAWESPRLDDAVTGTSTWTVGRNGIVATQEQPTPPGRFTISRGFEFSASHELRLLPKTHKCSGNHGHNYVVTLTLTADRLDGYGFVTDFGELNSFGDYLKSIFDHSLINNQVDFHPTSELLAFHLGRWFIDNVEPSIHGRLVSVRVAETRLSSALWERRDAL